MKDTFGIGDPEGIEDLLRISDLILDLSQIALQVTTLLHKNSTLDQGGGDRCSVLIVMYEDNPHAIVTVLLA